MSDLIIDGPIGTGEGEVSAAFVRAQLAAADPSETLTVRIHSEGGSVFEGFAIYDALQAYQGAKRCVIASSAFCTRSVSLFHYSRNYLDDIVSPDRKYQAGHRS